MSRSSGAAIRHALMIVNPGARRAERVASAALHEFERRQVKCEVVFTNAPGHATEYARTHAPKFDAVFTVGGDGTAMEVMTALVDGGPPVGILPGGTGNVLVRSLGISMNTGRAVRALLDGTEARIDLGRMSDGRHFAIGLGVGLDEAMIAGASRAVKKRLGVIAYVWSALRAGVKLERFTARITVDGNVFEKEASAVLIANFGSVLGGAIRFGDGILHDDGWLHACVYSPRNLREAIRLFTRMLQGTAAGDPAAFIVSGREFRLETDPPRRAQADGELLELTPIEISVRPGAGRILVPNTGAAASS